MPARTPCRPTSTAGTTTPSGGPTSCSHRSTSASRRSTASATTPGPGPPQPRRKARWSAGPTASPTSATTSKMPSPPASSPRRCCPADVRVPLRHHPWQQLGPSSRHGPRRRGHRAGGHGRRPEADGAGRLPPVQLPATSTSGRRRWPRPRRWSGCCRPWSSATPTARTCCPTTATRARRRQPEALRAAVTYVGGHDRPLRLPQAVALLGWDPRSSPPASTAAGEPGPAPHTLGCRLRRPGQPTVGRDRLAR